MPFVPTSCAHCPSRVASNKLSPRSSRGDCALPKAAAAGGSGVSRRGQRYGVDQELSYGEDAPNTGFRKMPPAEFGRQFRAVAKFPQRSIQDCYNSFPGEVKSSCPVIMSLDIPAGDHFSDPSTGSRHRPDAAEAHTSAVADSDSEEVARNRRWLEARRQPGPAP
eukprot:jgi/Ulvmu1/835/UM010_0209.1